MSRNSRNLELFPELVRPRAKPRVLMHVSDAGTASCGHASNLGKPLCRMLCGRCGLESDWVVFDTVSEAKRSAAWLAHGATRVERRACFPRRPLQTKKPVMKRAGEALKRLMRGCLAVGSAALLSAPPSHAFETADELYRACRMWQGTRLGGMTERMSRSDVLKAGLCAGYAQAWPAAYMLGAAAAAPAPSLRPNVPTPPGCFRPSRTSTGDVIMAIVRRYERNPLRMKTESPDLLTQLALREELPCAIR